MSGTLNNSVTIKGSGRIVTPKSFGLFTKSCSGEESEAIMNLYRKLPLISLWLLVLSITPAPGDAASQVSTDLVGAWTLISVTVDEDGKKLEPFGSNPNGSLILDGNGHFSIVVVRSDIPKFASDNRLKGTAEENKTAVQGSLAYFGTYSIQETNRIISMRIEGSTFPNWKGTEQKRLFSRGGDQLRLTNPDGSAGGRTEILWTRANS